MRANAHDVVLPTFTARCILIHFALDRGARCRPAADVNGNSSVIWTKTDAGRIEMQARALVKERAQRNLLLVIDGVKTEEMLPVSYTHLTLPTNREV